MQHCCPLSFVLIVCFFWPMQQSNPSIRRQDKEMTESSQDRDSPQSIHKDQKCKSHVRASNDCQLWEDTAALSSSLRRRTGAYNDNTVTISVALLQHADPPSTTVEFLFHSHCSLLQRAENERPSTTGRLMAKEGWHMASLHKRFWHFSNLIVKFKVKRRSLACLSIWLCVYYWWVLQTIQSIIIFQSDLFIYTNLCQFEKTKLLI